MSQGRQYIEFEGYFAAGVLGIFKVIRGFADLRDLAAVSSVASARASLGSALDPPPGILHPLLTPNAKSPAEAGLEERLGWLRGFAGRVAPC